MRGVIMRYAIGGFQLGREQRDFALKNCVAGGQTCDQSTTICTTLPDTLPDTDKPEFFKNWETVGNTGSGGRIRTFDLRVMSPMSSFIMAY